MDITHFLRHIEEAARHQINLAIAAERQALYNEVISFITMTQDNRVPAMETYTRNMGVFRSLDPAMAQKLAMSLKGYREVYAKSLLNAKDAVPATVATAPLPSLATNPLAATLGDTSPTASTGGPTPKKKVG